MQVTVNGVSLNYEVEGPEGAPWLTFSNSLATNLTMWDHQAAAFSKDYRVLRYDKRGHGGSEAPEGPYNFDMLIGDVIGLWDALGVEKSHFVGLSIGGMTAFGLALDHAHRVDKVVSSNARADAPDEFRAAWDQRIATVEAGGMAALADPTVERWSSAAFLASGSPALDKLRGMVASTSVTGFIGCARALQGLDFQRRFGEIDKKILLIGGAEDGGTPAENMRKMHGLLVGSEYIELPAGHISNMEQPEAHTEAVRAFLQ